MSRAGPAVLGDGDSDGDGMELDVKQLFIDWIEGWRIKAKQQDRKTQFMYGKAIKELKIYPHEIRTCYDAQKVKHIGPATVKMLGKNLIEYCETKGIPLPTAAAVSTVDTGAGEAGDSDAAGGKAKEKPKRAYIPNRGSGASAILLALYRASLQEHYRGFMTKSEICDRAQHFSTTSFTTADAGSYYTAWNGMTGLIAKDLVNKYSNPAKFELTLEGDELGLKLDAVLREDERKSSGAGAPQPAGKGKGKASARAPPAGTQPITQYTNPKTPTGSRHGGGGGSAGGPTTPMVISDNDSNFDCAGIFSPVANFGELSACDFDGLLMTKRQTSSKRSYDQSGSPSSGANASSAGRGRAGGQGPKLQKQKLGSASASLSSSGPTTKRTSTFELTSPSFALDPDNYEIILLVDTSEHRGGRDKNQIQQKLQGLGVKTEVKQLALGDFLWIAQEKTGMDEWTLHRKKGRELVLDYVIERKRMDDLASSIVDGRFLEQKFRFETAEIKQKIYLIENYGRIDNQRLDENALHAAIASTQVASGFFIKHTANTNATIAYLAVMHKKILSMFKDTRLVAKGVDEARHQTGARPCCTVYSLDDFQMLTTKSQILSVREMFAKQLMQMASVTAPKAAAIVEHYPTPQSLIAAYQALPEKKDREALLKQIQYDSGAAAKTKTLGPAISINIAQLYTAKELS